MYGTRTLVWSLVALAGAGGPSTAQEARFLHAARATVTLGEPVGLRLVESRLTGDDRGPAPLAWSGFGVEHVFARTAWTQENRDDAPAAARDAGPDALPTWPTDRPGILLLGCDADPREQLVRADELATFLRHVLPASRASAVGVGELADEGERQVRVRRVESLKTVVRVEAAGGPIESIATSKTGQHVEIRPLMDPTLVPVGSDLAVRVYASVPGPRGEGLVIATNTATGDVVRAPTNDTSLAVIPIGTAGEWRLEFHAATRVEPDPDAPDGGEPVEWLLHTATLTFEVDSADARGLGSVDSRSNGEEATR